MKAISAFVLSLILAGCGGNDASSVAFICSDTSFNRTGLDPATTCGQTAASSDTTSTAAVAATTPTSK
ncbi:hypothetical protein [Lacisediminimonas profundi]|uniref:hypothetical protein n=1 Tax=Lacisediminimonas profundi TaxID=2603856 RepID=UPI00124B0982|nr:hypothetical protein [Lacisediminimonas profundi]